MKTTKKICNIFLTMLMIPGVTMASSVKSEFQHCAAKALNAPLAQASQIEVDISQLPKTDAWAKSSRLISTLEMTLDDKATGKALANVVCRINSKGKVLDVDVEYFGDEIVSNIR